MKKGPKSDKKRKAVLKSQLSDVTRNKLSLIKHNGGETTNESMASPLGRASASMVHGRVAHNVKNLDNPGKAKVKRNKVFSNSVPHGYSKKEWNQQLKKVGR